MKDWFMHHWQDVLTYIGIGGGSGIIGKKMIDREQSKKLKDHEQRITLLESKTKEIEKDIETNTIFDKQLRSEFKDHRELMDKRLQRIEDTQIKIYEHLINRK